jgi:hypothetical protein
MKNVFSKDDCTVLINRINQLSPSSPALWGKMDAGKMLAHCNVSYEMAYENIHPIPNAFVKFILKLMVKNSVVGEKPYGKNKHTAPQFIITTSKDFEVEKKRLIDYINRTQELGTNEFEGKESDSFGKLTAIEWNIMFAKHLEHHLSQFGV